MPYYFSRLRPLLFGARLFGCLLLLSTSSCVVLLPFIESDYVPPAEHGIGTGSYSAGYYEPTRKRVVVRRAGKLTRLTKALEHSDPVVRTHAATDLGRMGSAAEPALDLLIARSASDPSKWVRRAAVKALAKIGTSRVVEPLRRATRDPDRWVAHSAQRALRQLGKQAT